MKKNFICWIDDLKEGNYHFLNCQNKVCISKLNHLSISINCAYAIFDYQLYAWIPKTENLYSDSFEFLSSEPIKFNNFGSKKVSKIIANTQICHIITEEGSVYSWGNDSNQTGILSLGDTYYQSSPVLNNNFKGKQIMNIAISEKHGAAIDNCHHIYTWGTGHNGELGLNNVHKTSSPMKVKTDILPLEIKCGNTYTILLDIKYNAYYMGIINKKFNHKSSIDSFRKNNLQLNNEYDIKQIQLNTQCRIANVFCGNTMIALIDIEGFLYLFSEDEGLNKVILDKKIKSVKFIRSNIYALGKESNCLYLFSSRTEMNILKEYVENLYNIDQSYSDINIIDTPFYDDALFFSLECTIKSKEQVVNKKSKIFTSIKSTDINSSLISKHSNSNYNRHTFDNYPLHNKTNQINTCTERIKSIYRPLSSLSSSCLINSTQGINKRNQINLSNKPESINDNALRISDGSYTFNLDRPRNDLISTLLDKIQEQKLDTMMSSSNALTKSTSNLLGKKKIELERVVLDLNNTNEFNKSLSKQSYKAYQNKDMSYDFEKFIQSNDSHVKEIKKRKQSQDAISKCYELNPIVYNKQAIVDDDDVDHRIKNKTKERRKRNKMKNVFRNENTFDEEYMPIKVFFGKVTNDGKESNEAIMEKSEIKELTENEICLNECNPMESKKLASNKNIVLMVNDSQNQRIIDQHFIKNGFHINDITKYYSEYRKHFDNTNRPIGKIMEYNGKETNSNDMNDILNEKATLLEHKTRNRMALQGKITPIKVFENEREFNSNDRFNCSQPSSIKYDSQSFLTQRSNLLNKNPSTQEDCNEGFIFEGITTKSTQSQKNKGITNHDRNYNTQSLDDDPFLNKQRSNDKREINYSSSNSRIDQNLLSQRNSNQSKKANEDVIFNHISSEGNLNEYTNSLKTNSMIVYEDLIMESNESDKNPNSNKRNHSNNNEIPKSDRMSMISIPTVQMDINSKNPLNKKKEEKTIEKYNGNNSNFSNSASTMYNSRNNKEKEIEKQSLTKTSIQLQAQKKNEINSLKSHTKSINDIGKSKQINYSSTISLKILDKTKERKNTKCNQAKESFRSKRNSSSAIAINHSEGTNLLLKLKEKNNPLNRERGRSIRLNETNSYRNQNIQDLSIDNNNKKPNLIQMPTPFNSKYAKPKALQSLDSFKRKLIGYLENNYDNKYKSINNQLLSPNRNNEEKNDLFRDFILKEFNLNDFINPIPSAISYKDLQEEVKRYIINHLHSTQMDKIKEKIDNIINATDIESSKANRLITLSYDERRSESSIYDPLELDKTQSSNILDKSNHIPTESKRDEYSLNLEKTYYSNPSISKAFDTATRKSLEKNLMRYLTDRSKYK